MGKIAVIGAGWYGCHIAKKLLELGNELTIFESKKDILTESYLLNFSNLAAEIVIPDLLTPGIKDKTWKMLIITTDFKVKSLSISLLVLNLSVM